MKVYTLVFNPFEENTYLVADANGDTLVIDPGCATPQECAQLDATVAKHGLHPRKMVLTHCHFDHTAGCAAVKAKYGITCGMSRGDLPYLKDMQQQGIAFGFGATELPEADFWLDDTPEIRWGEAALQVIATPGHSAGSVCFYAPGEHLLFAGDTIFQGSIGRTDLPGGNYDTLMDSIEQRILTLPPDTRIFSGHGPSSTLDEERLNNPFLLRLGRYL
ncbi:MAG: MBL fold metallo-hydrolase [Bacteroidales bacterium]|nr:MBL fold metallo-hydrolase [Bacteroidales bacterium]